MEREPNIDSSLPYAIAPRKMWSIQSVVAILIGTIVLPVGLVLTLVAQCILLVIDSYRPVPEFCGAIMPILFMGIVPLLGIFLFAWTLWVSPTKIRGVQLVLLWISASASILVFGLLFTSELFQLIGIKW
jgi:hypothetical protein